MKCKGKDVVAADITDISKVEMKQLLEQYFLHEHIPVEAQGPCKEMVWKWFQLMGEVIGNLELVVRRAHHGDVTL